MHLLSAQTGLVNASWISNSTDESHNVSDTKRYVLTYIFWIHMPTSACRVWCHSVTTTSSWWSCWPVQESHQASSISTENSSPSLPADFWLSLISKTICMNYVSFFINDLFKLFFKSHASPDSCTFVICICSMHMLVALSVNVLLAYTSIYEQISCNCRVQPRASIRKKERIQTTEVADRIG